MKKIITVALMALVFSITGAQGSCGGQPSADQIEAAQTQRMQKEASKRVGMPGVTNYLEKRWVAKLYEMRDKEVATYTYVTDMHGDLHHVCDSIGFGIPASVQFSNPDKFVRSSGAGYLTLPQAEPNGLFMPEGLSATYILCANEDGKGSPHPIYSEPQLVVSPFRLAAVSSWMQTVPSGQVIRPRVK